MPSQTQTPDVEVPSPNTTNSAASPAPPSPFTLDRRSPDRPSDAAQTTEAPFASMAGTVPADSRCQYRYQNATRCRLRAADSESGLCVRHLRQKFAALLPSFPDDTADLSKDLLPKGADFSSAEDLRDYLLRLLILMTGGRISPRRASVLAYISNQLLHSRRRRKGIRRRAPAIRLRSPAPQARLSNLADKMNKLGQFPSCCSQGLKRVNS